MNRLMQQDEMNMLFDDRELAVGVYMLNVVSAWPSIKVLNNILRGGPKRASEISKDINLSVQDVLDTLSDLEAIELVKCRYDEKERVKYWDVVDSRFKISLEGDESGIKVIYRSHDKETQGLFGRMCSGIKKHFRNKIKDQA